MGMKNAKGSWSGRDNGLRVVYFTCIPYPSHDARSPNIMPMNKKKRGPEEEALIA